MTATDGEIGDSEWLLRRIPEDRGPTDTESQPSPLAFRPHERDTGGLSLYRERVVSAVQLAGWGATGKRYFVGRLQAGAIRGLGMSVRIVHDARGRPGHVVIPELNANTRKGAVEESWQARLAAICETVGPFSGSSA